MIIIQETNKKPSKDGKDYIPYSVSKMELSLAQLKVYFDKEYYDFFTEKLERMMELSGVEEMPEFKFSYVFNANDNAIVFSEDIPQALNMLQLEKTISQATCEKALKELADLYIIGLAGIVKNSPEKQKPAIKSTITSGLNQLTSDTPVSTPT